MAATFDHLYILGRPAAGKSEFMDFMKRVPDGERAGRFRIGRFVELDDFVWLWEKFREDDIWEKVLGRRLYSSRYEGQYNMEDARLFDFLIEKLNREVLENYLPRGDFYADGTLFIEFSRGGETPYSGALAGFDPKVLSRAAILYIEVSREESFRRNEARYREKLKHTVLAHKCPEPNMKRFYSDDDWPAITKGKRSGTISVNGVEIPFATMNNEPESTDPAVLGLRYGAALEGLWGIYSKGSRSKP
jgi:hypothetical protein